MTPIPDFLLWIHDRLEKVHGENRDVDYMIRLREIAHEARTGLSSPRVVVELMGKLRNEFGTLYMRKDVALTAVPSRGDIVEGYKVQSVSFYPGRLPLVHVGSFAEYTTISALGEEGWELNREMSVLKGAE